MKNQVLKNLLRGMGTVLEIMPPPRRRIVYHKSVVIKSPNDAIRGDLQRIGGDFNRVIRKIDTECMSNG